MSLKLQKKGSLEGGVNQQSAETRKDNQVKEMINCLPTLDQGLRLRNSTAPLKVYGIDDLTNEITFPKDNESPFIYEYDRGSIGDRSSELAFIITKEGGLEIVDLTLSQEMDDQGQEVLAGTIYKDGLGINYQNDDARAYLGALVVTSNFSMTTVKDTTFVVNKGIQPMMLPTFDDDVDDPTLVKGSVIIDYNSITGLNPETVTGSNGSFVFTTPSEATIMAVQCVGAGGGGGGTAGYYIADNPTVVPDQAHPITIGVGGAGGEGSDRAGHVGLIGGETVAFGFTLAGGNGGAGGSYEKCGHTDCPCNTGKAGTNSPLGAGGIAPQCTTGESHSGHSGNAGSQGGGGSGASGGTGGGYYGDSGGVGKNGGVGGGGRVIIEWDLPTSTVTEKYEKEGYIHIKRIDTVDGYAYGAVLTIKNAQGVNETITIPSTGLVPDDSTLAASTLADLITTTLGARGKGTASGSIIKIELLLVDELLVGVDATDTFGDLASFGWGHNVDTLADLPPNMAGFPAIVEVGEPREPTYWLIYSDKKWVEYHRPQIYTQLDAKTMPHTITRRLNPISQKLEFYVEQYDWGSRKYGDDETNAIPSFAKTPDDESDTFTPIKDLFFFRNRLGFITSSSVACSEVGEYGNFFRTSVAALLDSDRIDAGVESTNAVNLAYSIILEDSVILFADKAQFRFKGGNILSPSSYTIQQEMAYDVNINVRPLFMNDRIFFVARRGRHSAIYEMMISNGSGQNSYASDITSHCQSYIDKEVDKLTGSAVDNMLFVTSKAESERSGDPQDPLQYKRNTTYVYKYMDSGNTRVQSAWFKWTYNGDVLAGFAISRNYYLLIKRASNLSATDWILGTGEWRMNKSWKMLAPWIMSPEDLAILQQFERMPIHPKDIDKLFLDNYNTPIDGFVDLGDFAYGTEGKKMTDGNTMLKTIDIRVGDGSKVILWVRDKQRDDYREVPSEYVVGRRPMIYGNADNVSLGIKNSGISGFRVNEVQIEANVISRTRSI